VQAGILLLAALFANPQEVKQGHLLKVQAPAGSTAVRAQFGGVTIRLFANPDGSFLGLMPVRVDQAPGPAALKLLDPAGQTVRESTVQVVDAKFPIQNVDVNSTMSSLKPRPGEADAVKAFNQTASDVRYWDESFTRPVPGCVNSPFGLERYHNGKPAGRHHLGVDMRGVLGTPVKAPAPGVVRLARKLQLQGGTVGIDHGQGAVTSYYHLSRLAVREGQIVKRGQIIAYVGATGFATGPHLHWNFIVNGVQVDPLEWAPSIRACP
jgi:murein DD-endopeptidase MepM/ murein hydrolase activator NlpD